MNSTKLTTREWLHKMIDQIDDEKDLDMLKWLTQPYAARSLNNKHKEAMKNEEG